MTNSEFYNTIINGEFSADMQEKAKSLLAQMDKKRSASIERNKTKRAKENEPLLLTLRELMLDGKSRLTSEIATDIGVSVSKASPLAKKLVDAGFLSVEDVKVPKKGLQKCYTIVTQAEEIAE